MFDRIMLSILIESIYPIMLFWLVTMQSRRRFLELLSIKKKILKFRGAIIVAISWPLYLRGK